MYQNASWFDENILLKLLYKNYTVIKDVIEQKVSTAKIIVISTTRIFQFLCLAFAMEFSYRLCLNCPTVIRTKCSLASHIYFLNLKLFVTDASQSTKRLVLQQYSID